MPALCFADLERSIMQNNQPTILSGTGIYQNATGPMRYRLTNDYLFKQLLQRNQHVLKALICSLLHFSPDQVADAIVTNPIILGEQITDKTIILDVNVVFNNGSRINMEMQVVNERNWPERSTLYACRNFADLNEGEKYKDIKPVYQVGFLDFTLFPEQPVFYSTYKLMDLKTQHIFTEKLSIRIIDLTEINLATEEDKRYNIDRWARLFKAQTWEEIKMLAAQDTIMEDAATTLYQLSEDERIRMECWAREDRLKREQAREDLIEEQKQALAEKEQELAEKDLALQSKDQELQSKDQALVEKDKIIAELQARLTAGN